MHGLERGCVEPEKEFLPGVFTGSGFSEPHGYDSNGTFVLHEEGNLSRIYVALDFDGLLVGDGVPIRAGARERLRERVAGFPSD